MPVAVYHAIVATDEEDPRVVLARRVYERALKRNAEKNSEESARFLQAARDEMKIAELRDQQATQRPRFDCDTCGWQMVDDAWTSPDAVPAWAVAFAEAGFAGAKRYRCPECGHVTAVRGVGAPRGSDDTQ